MEQISSFFINHKILSGSLLACGSLFAYANIVHPLLTRNPNGFSSSTTAEQVIKGISLQGKVCIITGSNTGIGLETARVLCQQGAHVILSGRDEKKLKDAQTFIQKSASKDSKVDYIPMDLGSSKSIDAFVESFKKMKLPLHFLINNAGVMMTPEQKTLDGFEYQIGINHFGHFRLSNLLLPIMKETEGERRIVVVSSRAHQRAINGKIDFENINWEKNYSSTASYSQSKLANIMFSNELNRKLKKDGIPITVNSLHPGVIPGTELSRDFGVWKYIVLPVVSLFLKSVEQGAATTVYATVSKELEGKGGLYLADCYPTKAIDFANDEEGAKKLWELSEKATGVSYPSF
jgi:NAD(P)-dependent dehydrogenase (short-subunit alcohol dehydrogenase family)